MQAGVIVPTLLGWGRVRILLCTGLLQNFCRRIFSLVLLSDLVEVPAWGVPSCGMPTWNMPTTPARMQCAAAHAVAPTGSATSDSCVPIAEVANMVHPAEGRTPLLERCVQAGVIVPTLLGWRRARLLLCAGHFHESIRRRIVSLVLLSDLVEVPACGMPSCTMPATTPRMQRAAAHAVPPASSAASHSGVPVAEVADVVHPAEGRTPPLKSCMQAGVIVPTLLGW